MKKNFEMENDIGVKVKYTSLGTTLIDGETYVVYTNYMPADNELGIRLLVGKLISEEPFQLGSVHLDKQREIIDSFKIEIVKSGRTIKRK